MGDSTETLTLAFDRSAVEALARPEAAFADARQWSRHVGIVGNDADAVGAVLADHDLDPDFEPGGRDKWLALSEVRSGTDTDRYVFVGDGPEDRRVADHLGWEYLPVGEAARKAEWPLDADDRKGGLFGRLRDLLPGGG